MAGRLKPGGWPVIEDPTYLPAASSPYPDFAALPTACEKLMARIHGTDNSWARRIPMAMADAGPAAWLGAGGSPGWSRERATSVEQPTGRSVHCGPATGTRAGGVGGVLETG
ncbi:hypothetical protein KPP03845_100756 [Streptomyces xanthophaeus]|nr:hypothetical protein KPP03845_100756 [Streptomyces xanthophaeus]